MTGESAQAPQPSAEERALQAEQAALIRENRDIARMMFEQQQLLAPYMYKQLGLKPIFDDRSQGLTQERQNILAEIAQITGDPVYDGLGTNNPLNIGDNYEIRDLGNARLQTLKAQLADVDDRIKRYKPEITGFEEIDPAELDPNYHTKQAIEKGLLDRSLAALKGELPVDAGLTNDLARQEETLREVLRKELGAGYETSTPGMRRLEEFNLRRNQVLDGARRGDLTLAEQLSQAREMQGQAYRTGEFNFYNTPYAQAAGLANNSRTLSGSLAGNLLGYHQGNRQLELQASIQRSANDAQLWGSIMRGAGTAIGIAGGAAIGACWIAEELYGKDSDKVKWVRADLYKAAEESPIWNALLRIYETYGQQIAAAIKTDDRMRALFQALFDALVESPVSKSLHAGVVEPVVDACPAD